MSETEAPWKGRPSHKPKASADDGEQSGIRVAGLGTPDEFPIVSICCVCKPPEATRAPSNFWIALGLPCTATLKDVPKRALRQSSLSSPFLSHLSTCVDPFGSALSR